MVEAASSPAANDRSLLAPLQYRLYRAIWIATLFSNLGTWIQSVGAAWLMTSLAPSPDMVALVQAATALPTLAFSLAAGAVADLRDRRIVLLVTQSWMLVSAALLAALEYLGVMGPWTLLGLTFLLGVGAAFNGPAWQASVGELVPREHLPSAVALNSVSFNLARSVGPAIGGLLVAAAGAKLAFLVNAFSYVGMIVVLFFWRPPPMPAGLPRERLWSAMSAGLRYARQVPLIQTVIVRSIAFGLCASALWALLPLIAKQDLGGGPLTYGILLGALGVGALIGAVFIGTVRRRLGTEGLITISTVVFGAAMVAVAVAQWVPLVLLVLVTAGATWLAALSTFNVAVQISTSSWVKARAISIYLMSVFGGLTFGSWAWGAIAAQNGVSSSLAAAGAAMFASLLLRHRYRLPEAEDLDLRPARAWPEPKVALNFDWGSGPILVTIEYFIAADKAEPFTQAMRELRRIRRRDGATRWRLYQDIERPERWLELFVLDTWLDHLRQRVRSTLADQELWKRVIAFHTRPEPPAASYMIVHETAWPAPVGTDHRLDRA